MVRVENMGQGSAFLARMQAEAEKPKPVKRVAEADVIMRQWATG
jgi:hypothetical protein